MAHPSTPSPWLGLAVAVLAIATLPACPPEVPKTSFDPMEAFDKRGDAMFEVSPPNKPAVRRGGPFAGFKEEFNRHYTDPGYVPKKTVTVSNNGEARSALRSASAGTKIVFKKGEYSGCFEVTSDGSYDAPIVLYGERNSDGSLGVKIQCCGTERASCFNFEAVSHIAVDGFLLRGGKYGVRAVGGDYAATRHSAGIAVLNSRLEGQGMDGVLTGAVDWGVFENNVVTDNGEDDGHGIYLSNGSDLNIVRNNDLFDNAGATFQINADPASTCGGDYSTDDCDAIAGTGDGGRGASDFFLVENNYFHHGTAQGSNFASVRYSTIRNNVFGGWAKHGVSFYSEMPGQPGDKKGYNPKLGSHHNRIHHNTIFNTNDRHILQVISNSDYCDVRNNLLIGMTVSGNSVKPRPSAVWLETDETVSHSVFENNVYLAGKFDGRKGPNKSEMARQDFDPKWFTKLPVGLPSAVSDFRPRPGAPFLDKAPRIPSVMLDRDGKPRAEAADPGAFEIAE